MIVIAFALPDESQDLARALQEPASTLRDGVSTLAGKLASREVVVVHTGMGASRTRERLNRFWNQRPAEPVEMIISAGYAGGLDPHLGPGALVLADNYCAPELLALAGEILGEQARVGRLATSPVVLETCTEKAAFAKQSSGIAVDMETATISEFCRENGIPLLSLRVISDTATEELAVPFSVCFDAETERPRIASLLGFLITHPQRIPSFARFVGTVGRARRLLTDALLKLAEKLPISQETTQR